MTLGEDPGDGWSPAALLHGDEDPRPDGPGLAALGGWLYSFTGNETMAYGFAAQAAYVTYAGLLGYHPLLFAHAPDASALAGAWRRFEDDARWVRARTGLPVPALPPVVVVLDAEQRPDLDATRRLPRLPGAPTFEAVAAAAAHLRCNQVTALHAATVAAFAAYLGAPGPVERAERLAALADVVARLHRKSAYLDLLATTADPLPRHVPTQRVPLDALPAAWPAFTHLLTVESTTGRYVLKSDRDACGEVIAYVDADAYADGVAALRAEALGKLAHERRDPDDLAMLVQPRLEPGEGEEAVPPRFGVSCFVRGPGDVETTAVARQLYRTADRRAHLGSYWSDVLDREVTADLGREAIRALCDLLARAGHRGPVGFDGMRDADGHAVLIADCNPRATGMLPVLAVREHLRAAGLRPRSVAGFGCYGVLRAPNRDRLAETCDRAGLAFRVDRPRGVLPLPRFGDADPDRLDVFFVDLDFATFQATAEQLADAGFLTIDGVYA